MLGPAAARSSGGAATAGCPPLLASPLTPVCTRVARPAPSAAMVRAGRGRARWTLPYALLTAHEPRCQGRWIARGPAVAPAPCAMPVSRAAPRSSTARAERRSASAPPPTCGRVAPGHAHRRGSVPGEGAMFNVVLDLDPAWYEEQRRLALLARPAGGRKSRKLKERLLIGYVDGVLILAFPRFEVSTTAPGSGAGWFSLNPGGVERPPQDLHWKGALQHWAGVVQHEQVPEPAFGTRAAARC